MATQIYRYRRTTPFDIGKLKDEVGSSVTFIAADGGHIVEYQIEDTTEDVADLDASLLLKGYARIADNPTDNPEDAFTPSSGGGSGGGSASSGYKFNTSLSAANPGTGNVSFDNATYASITKVYINDTPDSPAIDFGIYLGQLNEGDQILVKQNDSKDRAVLLDFVSAVDNTGWWTLTVTHSADGGGSIPQNNRACTVSLIHESTHIKHNLNATVDPVGTDDNTKGYEVGSVWIRNGTSKTWIAGSVGTGTASWIDMTAGSSPVVSIPAEKMKSSLNANMAVNGSAPLATDTNDAGLKVRLFDDTTEGGPYFYLDIPAEGAGSMQMFTRGRAETGPGGAAVVKLLAYFREIVDNGAVGSWSSAEVLSDVDLPTTTEFFHEDETDQTIAAWGLTVGKRYQVQVTRTSTGDTLSGDFALADIRVGYKA